MLNEVGFGDSAASAVMGHRIDLVYAGYIVNEKNKFIQRELAAVDRKM